MDFFGDRLGLREGLE